MTAFQTLTLRSNAAMARLATLQRRAERLPASASNVVAAALAEVDAVLQHLNVATNQIEAQAAELNATHRELTLMRERFHEFAEALPLPCIWTTPTGEIEFANKEAAEWLNVAAARLPGRSLLLFITERDRFSETLRALNAGDRSAVELSVSVRPRERRARAVRLLGRRLQSDASPCWFFLPPKDFR